MNTKYVGCFRVVEFGEHDEVIYPTLSEATEGTKKNASVDILYVITKADLCPVTSNPVAYVRNGFSYLPQNTGRAIPEDEMPSHFQDRLFFRSKDGTEIETV